MNTRRLLLSLIILLLLPVGDAFAATLRVAVASNFSQAAKQLAASFNAQSGHRLLLSFGATGKHYAQISNGAPFDLFLAADRRRPELLDRQGLIVPGSRFTYAVGRLVLWSPQADLVDPQGRVLTTGRFRHLAIANPKLAPYGRAAWQVIEKLSLQEALQGRLVRGENIGQTFQFVSSGNADLGFVALSQVQRPDRPVRGSLWRVPETLYSPIVQQAVLLKESTAGRDFIAFLKSPETTRLLRGFGYTNAPSN